MIMEIRKAGSQIGVSSCPRKLSGRMKKRGREITISNASKLNAFKVEIFYFYLRNFKVRKETVAQNFINPRDVKKKLGGRMLLLRIKTKHDQWSFTIFRQRKRQQGKEKKDDEED